MHASERLPTPRNTKPPCSASRRSGGAALLPTMPARATRPEVKGMPGNSMHSLPMMGTPRKGGSAASAVATAAGEEPPLVAAARYRSSAAAASARAASKRSAHRALISAFAATACSMKSSISRVAETSPARSLAARAPADDVSSEAAAAAAAVVAAGASPSPSPPPSPATAEKARQGRGCRTSRTHATRDAAAATASSTCQPSPLAHSARYATAATAGHNTVAAALRNMGQRANDRRHRCRPSTADVAGSRKRQPAASATTRRKALPFVRNQVHRP